MKATIDVWQFIPAVDEEAGFLTYRFAGVVNGEPFCGEVSMEIDGRDGEYKHLWGVDIAPDQFFGDKWDAVLVAMSENATLEADMAHRTNEFYAA